MWHRNPSGLYRFLDQNFSLERAISSLSSKYPQLRSTIITREKIMQQTFKHLSRWLLSLCISSKVYPIKIRTAMQSHYDNVNLDFIFLTDFPSNCSYLFAPNYENSTKFLLCKLCKSPGLNPQVGRCFSPNDTGSPINSRPLYSGFRGPVDLP